MQKIINFVGIDMAKNDFYACLGDVIEPQKFNNDTKGIKSFFNHLKRYDFQKENTLLGVESTASYHLKLCIESTENIDPRVHQSGTSINGKGYISKRGNKILRTRLFNAAAVAVLQDNMFKAFFQKKKSEGKPYRVALVATMRKMTHVIHAVWTRGTPFVK